GAGPELARGAGPPGLLYFWRRRAPGGDSARPAYRPAAERASRPSLEALAARGPDLPAAKPPRGAQDRGRALDADLPQAKAAAHAAGGPRRRVRVDGPLCAVAAPVPLRAPERVLPGGDVRLRHAVEPGNRRAPGAGIPGRPREPLGPCAGLERRHAHRR